jgi:hypothetical protein
LKRVVVALLLLALASAGWLYLCASAAPTLPPINKPDDRIVFT